MPNKSDNPCMKIFFLLIILFTFLRLPKMLNCNNKRLNQNKRSGNRGKYVVYGYMGCPYTVKQLDEFKQKNVPFKFVDTNTPRGGAEFDKVNGGERGVPLTINASTGKQYHGFTQFSSM